tara:strand:+ start:11263 stop:12384 length:1122 start_codon:yes stop_codon:yes gene_type:complete
MHYFNSNLNKSSFIIDSNGPWLIDNKGKYHFDTWLGSGTLIFGHAQIKQPNICNMLPSSNLFDVVKPTLINKLVDFEIGSIGIQTSGSSAITRACRVARAATNKRLIALIADFWHGSEDEFLFRHKYELLSDGLAITPSKNFVWFNSIESFLSNAKTQEFAAILIEPNQGSNPKENVIKDLLNITNRKKLIDDNVLVIFDEIITGFRDNYGSSKIARKCHPDIVVFGKAIGGGYPIGLVLVNKSCTELAKNKKIFWGGTFSANPTQLDIMNNQLKQLNEVDYKLLDNNLTNLCSYINEKLKIYDLGYRISKGSGFARILRDKQINRSSRGFLFNHNKIDSKFKNLCIKNNIFIANNHLIFPSIYNIFEKMDTQ